MLSARHDQVADEFHQNNGTLRVATYLGDLALEELFSLAGNLVPLRENSCLVSASKVTMSQASHIVRKDAFFILFDHEAKVKG